jgi:hypothetical protein
MTGLPSHRFDTDMQPRYRDNGRRQGQIEINGLVCRGSDSDIGVSGGLGSKRLSGVSLLPKPSGVKSNHYRVDRVGHSPTPQRLGRLAPALFAVG